MNTTPPTHTQILVALAISLAAFAACGGSKKPTPPAEPTAVLPDTNILRTEALGTIWHPYVNNALGFRFNLPRAAQSDMVESDGVIRFLGWVQPDTTAYRAGLFSYLVGEPGFLFQIYRRPYTSFNKEYTDFEELGADYYRTHATDRRRPMTNGAFISLQDSALRAFTFDTEIDFGEGHRTPLLLYPDRIDDPDENAQLRTPARVLYLSHRQYNYRIIYQLNNPLAEGMAQSILFY